MMSWAFVSGRAPTNGGGGVKSSCPRRGLQEEASLALGQKVGSGASRGAWGGELPRGGFAVDLSSVNATERRLMIDRLQTSQWIDRDASRRHSPDCI